MGTFRSTVTFQLQAAFPRKVRYITIDLPYRPYKHAKEGGGARRRAAKQLASNILRRLGSVIR